MKDTVDDRERRRGYWGKEKEKKKYILITSLDPGRLG